MQGAVTTSNQTQPNRDISTVVTSVIVVVAVTVIQLSSNTSCLSRYCSFPYDRVIIDIIIVKGDDRRLQVCSKAYP